MKCPSLEQIYDMDLDNLLTLKSNIEQNKIDFNIIPLDEDDFDLYDYNSPNDKESILELVNSEIKERESTKDLLNFFTNLNFDTNENNIESKFLKELNSNSNKMIDNSILQKNEKENKIIKNIVEKNNNNNINNILQLPNNKNILNYNKNINSNLPVKLTPNEGIKSLLNRTKIDPTQLQYTVSSNRFVDRFWSFDKEKKNKKKPQTTQRDSDISNSNGSSSNTNFMSNGTYHTHLSTKSLRANIKSERKNWVISEKIVIGAIPMERNKTKKKKKKKKIKKNNDDENKKVSCLELMRNYKVSDVTQFLKKKTNLKPLNVSTANNKNHNCNNKNKLDNNEFAPNIKLYNKTQYNINDNKIESNDIKNKIINNKNVEINANVNKENNNNLNINSKVQNDKDNKNDKKESFKEEKNNNSIFNHFYFEYSDKILKEIKYETKNYPDLIKNETNNFNNKNKSTHFNKNILEINKNEPIVLTLNAAKDKNFLQKDSKNENKTIYQGESQKLKNEEKISEDNNRHIFSDKKENENEINLGKLYDNTNKNENNNINIKNNFDSEKKEEKIIINGNNKNNINNNIKSDKVIDIKENDNDNEDNDKEIIDKKKAYLSEENKKDNESENENELNKEKIENESNHINYQKQNRDEYENQNSNDNKKYDINDNNENNITDNYNNNQKEETQKEDENEEEYEEEEDEIDEEKDKINNNKEQKRNNDIIQELLQKKSNNLFLPNTLMRDQRKKRTLNPIKPKNKNLNNFNMNMNLNINSTNLHSNKRNKINKSINNNNSLNDKKNFSETSEKKNDNQIQNKKYVLSSVKHYNNNSHYSQYNNNKNLLKFPMTQRPKTTLLKNPALDNSHVNIDMDKIVDYSDIYQSFSELFSGYFLSNNYSQQNNFNFQNTIGELYESFNKLYCYELNKGLIDQKDEMYNDIVNAEAGVIINRIKHAQEKLLKEEDINTNIEKYCVLKRCLELERKNYGRDDCDDPDEKKSEIYQYKKFFRVVLSRPEIYDIVCYTLYKDSTWSELPHGLSLGQCWNLYWSYGPPNIEFSKLFSFQKVNHLINNRIVHRKDLLHKHITRVRKLNKKCNELFNIMPLTFLLSKEYVNFVEEFHRIKGTDDYNIWIVKPVGKSRGKGIFLIDNISDVPLNDTFLVQKYLSSPLLLDEGYKFDMRIYCLVTSVNPLEMFLYKDGFARVSNEIYSMDITNIKVHLTNAAIQNRQAKKSKNFEKIYGGSKISLDMLKYKLRKQYGIDFDSVIWPQVKDIITKVFICCQNDIPYCPSTFEMFGFDVIIDSDLKCWLLEINSSPSLERSNVLDDEIKLPLVKDIMKIVDPVEVDKLALINVLERVMKIKNNPNNKNVYLYSPKIQLNIDLTNIFYGKKPRKYGEEPKDMGRFEMICPNKETDKLIKLAGGQKFYNNKREKK